jgi:hypothetical protein
MKPIAFALVVFLSVPAAARSVAMLINFGDAGGDFDQKFTKMVARAKQIYAQLGYDVVVIPPSKDIRSQIDKEFKELGKVDQLSVETLGHGMTDPPPKEHAERYPALKHRPSNGLYEDAPDTFHFANSAAGVSADENRESGRKAKIVFTHAQMEEEENEWSKATLESRSRYDVGVGDFDQWFKGVRDANPQASVKIAMGECYSGHAARSFTQMKNVQAYSGASDKIEAHADQDHGDVEFHDFYFDQLEQAAKDGTNVTHLDAFDRAREKWMPISSSIYGESEVPWSPVDAFINNWCTSHSKAAAKDPARLSPLLARLKTTSDLTLKYEMDVVKLRNSKWHCLDSGNPELLKKMLRETADIEITSLSDMREKLKESTRAEAEIRKTLECLKASPESECKFDPGVLSELPKDFVPDERFKASREEFGMFCVGTEFDQAKTCFERVMKIKAKYPEMVFLDVFLLRMDLMRRVEDCKWASSARHDFYKACYDRFWSEAGEQDRDELEKMGRLTQMPVRASNGSSSPAVEVTK